MNHDNDNYAAVYVHYDTYVWGMYIYIYMIGKLVANEHA